MVHVPYSQRLNFWQYFFTAVYRGRPLTPLENFTEIVAEEPLRWQISVNMSKTVQDTHILTMED